MQRLHFQLWFDSVVYVTKSNSQLNEMFNNPPEFEMDETGDDPRYLQTYIFKLK